jgi:hypothetical protein
MESVLLASLKMRMACVLISAERFCSVSWESDTQVTTKKKKFSPVYFWSQASSQYYFGWFRCLTILENILIDFFLAQFCNFIRVSIISYTGGTMSRHSNLGKVPVSNCSSYEDAAQRYRS